MAIKYKLLKPGKAPPDWAYYHSPPDNTTEEDVKRIAQDWERLGYGETLKEWQHNVTATKNRQPLNHARWIIWPEFIEPMFGEELCP